MVMSVMREKTKIVLFIALLAFVGLIFFDWGMQGGGGGNRAQGGVIGEVNGREISIDEYRRARQSIVADFEARTGRSPEYDDFDAIEEETWISLVREALLQQEIERHGIRVTDAEIVEVLRTDPPAFLRSQPVFADENGQFDPVRYQQALADPSFDWLPVESYLRALLPVQKLENYVGMNARLTSDEVRRAFLDRNEKAKVRHVRSASSAVELEEGAVTDADVRAWYDEHPEDWTAGEQAILEMVRVPKTPSTDDSLLTKQDLEDVRQSLVEGADFAELAGTWSDDGASAGRGGDLGFVGRGAMVAEFEEMAFSTPVGELSPVFPSDYGYHLLKVEERREQDGEEQRRVRHILMRIEPSNTTLREAGRTMDDFLFALEDRDDFAAVAAEQGLEVERTEPFERDGMIPGVGRLRSASRFAFAHPVGAVTPDAIEDRDAIYAFRVAQRIPAGPIPFEDVEDAVRARVEEETRREEARRRLEAAMAEAPGDLDAIASALGAAVDTTAEFSRESFVAGVGRRNGFVAAAFATPAGSIAGPVGTDRGWFVLEVLERIPADETLLAEQRDGLRQQLMARKRQTLVAAWIESLLTEAEVVDYRSGRGVPWTPQPEALQYARGA